MKVVEAIEFLRGLDKQFVYERDNHWSRLAELFERLAEHAEPSLRESDVFEGFEVWKSQQRGSK